jgi:integrase
VYWACATPPGGRQALWKRLGVVNLAEARRLRDLFAAEVQTRQVPSTKRTFGQVAEEWLAEMQRLMTAGELRPATVAGYQNTLRLHTRPLDRMRVSAITCQTLNAWHAGRQRDGAAASTISRDFVAVRLVLRFALRHGYASQDPADLLTRRERPRPGERRVRFLNDAEIRALLTAAPDGPSRTMVLTLAYTGLRFGEVLGLRWRDIDFERGFIYVRWQLQGQQYAPLKTGASQRDVVLLDPVAAELKRHKLASPFSAPEDPVFASVAGTPLDSHNARRRMIRPTMERAQLDDVTPHVLRHTYCALVINLRPEPYYVAAQMGHSDPAFTYRRYGHLFDAARHSADLRRELGAVASSQLASVKHASSNNDNHHP